MSETRFSFKKELNNAISNKSHNSKHSFNQTKTNNKINKTKRLRYFDVYRQVKEEMLKNNNENNKKDNSLDKRKEEILDHLYLKNTSQINDYYKKNYNIIEIQGTRELLGIDKKDLSLQVKKNQNTFIENMPLKYRNPELNKNRKKVNCTPIPYSPHKDSMYNFEKEELNKAKEKAVFIRKTEYTHANPPPKSIEEIFYFQNKKNLLFKRLFIINKVKLIQKWYRFIKKNRNNKNDNIINEKDKIDNYDNNKNKLDYKNENNSEKNKNYLKNEISKNKNISFEILKLNAQNNQDINHNILKPSNYCCYITKDEMILLNNSEDMINLNILQKKVKQFLKDKNQINMYKIYKQMNQKIIENEKKDLQISSNKQRKNNLNDNNHNSEGIFRKKRPISKKNSLQSIGSIHNFTMKENNNIFFNELPEDNDNNENSSYINSKQNNNEESDSNLMNFSFNSDKNKTQKKDGSLKKIKKNIDYKNGYYISKNIYYNSDYSIKELKKLQKNIRKYLVQNKNNELLHFKNNSENDNNIDMLQKSYESNFIIKDNSFNSNSKDINYKARILKLLLNKYNKKLNKEVENNCKIYYDKVEEKNKIIKISKNKLAFLLVEIIKNYLQKLFNDIYQYESINYKREKCLLRIVNNINSKLKRYFYIWSNRPLKLLIYKTKSVRYYNSLFALKNNIKRLIRSIYNIFIGKYFYIFIINYLNMNNIDIKNNKIFSFLKNKNKLKLFYEISKNIPKNKGKDDDINKLTLIEYFKEFENLNNSKFNLAEE